MCTTVSQYLNFAGSAIKMSMWNLWGIYPLYVPSNIALNEINNWCLTLTFIKQWLSLKTLLIIKSEFYQQCRQ